MKLEILDINGMSTSRFVEFKNEFFLKKFYGYPIYLEMKRYLFSQRQGTHKSKEKGEITGSNKKLYRQKGTGSSRKGDCKNPIFKGGGRVFGPKPKKYSIKLNKRTKKKVKRFLIEQKIIEKKIIIVENIQFKSPKTKLVIKFVKSLKINYNKFLIVFGKYNNNFYLSSRNLKNFKTIHINELDCFSLMNFPYVIFFENSIDTVQKYLSE
ncbi:50S ribosomal protein L4 [Blattabacterium cuenoti]|uniref:50S ribosomal protein L4 n=1 Tax=Blattabacterium cuenoti TaxID=1653831 RepID=UPI00163BCFBE|nr:50S ribosomal protein L4 [Blattabacterium cuenoti]